VTRILLPALVASLALAAPQAPASAQAAMSAADIQRTDRRISRLESEMRAVQRKVFPGGAGALAPEITEAPAQAPTGLPASNPVTDLAERLGALEQQLQSLTGQVEANEFKVRQMEEQLKRLQGDIEFRLNRLEGGPAPEAGITPATPSGSVSIVPPPATTPAARPGQTVPPVGTAALPATPPVQPPAAPPPAAIVTKGATAIVDWQAAYAHVLNKRWDQTEAHMTAFLANWPASTRIPQAQYWLGRSHAERNQHAQAADAYLKVYNNHPRSERAPDALIGLSGALIGIRNPQQACRVLSELNSVYGASLTPAQKAEAATLKGRARC
jgi:tol-pal system protein YbgF